MPCALPFAPPVYSVVGGQVAVVCRFASPCDAPVSDEPWATADPDVSLPLSWEQSEEAWASGHGNAASIPIRWLSARYSLHVHPWELSADRFI